MIAASLLLASWVLVLSPLFRSRRRRPRSPRSSASPTRSATWSSAPSCCSSWPGPGWAGAPAGHPLPLLGGGLVAIAVADSGFVYLTASGSYSSGALIDAGWFLGYLLILLAARKPEDDGGRRGRGRRPASTAWGCSCPTSPWSGRWSSAPSAQLQQGTLDSFAAWCRSFIILALVGRQVLSLLENLHAGPPPGGPGDRAHRRAAGQRAALPGPGPAQLRGRHPGRRRRQRRVRQRVHDQGLRLQRGPPARPAADPDPRPRGPGSACARAWPRCPSGPTACSSWSCRCATATATTAPSSSRSPTCSTTPASAGWCSTPATSPNAASSRTSSSTRPSTTR